MQEITLSISDGIALITLNKPDRHNAYTVEMSAELSDAMIACNSDDSVRAVVLTGAGDSFCIGMDLSDLSDKLGQGDERPTFSKRTYPFEISKPVICAMNGRAGGFGAAYPMTCDIRVMDEDATLAFSFVRGAMIPEMGSTWTLPRLSGIGDACELLLTGKKIDGRRAKEIGLVSHAVKKDDVLPLAMEIAKDIAKSAAPVAVAMTKRLIWDRLEKTGGLGAMVLEDRDYFMDVVYSTDGREGAMAFVEKREPEWKGSVNQELPGIYP